MFKHLDIINDVLPFFQNENIYYTWCILSSKIAHEYKVFRLSAYILPQAPKK